MLQIYYFHNNICDVYAIFPVRYVFYETRHCRGETLFRVRVYLLARTSTAGVYDKVHVTSKTYRSLIIRIMDHGETSWSYTSKFASVVKQLSAFNDTPDILVESIYLLLVATALQEYVYVFRSYDWRSLETEQNAGAITISATLITI